MLPCLWSQTSQLVPSVTMAPLANSSRAWMFVGVSTGTVSPLRGPEPMVRVGKVAEAMAPTRFTGPISCTRLVT